MNRLPLLLCLLLVSAWCTAQETPAGNPSVAISQATLDSYVGTYRISPGFALKIWREGASLYVQAEGQAAQALVAESESSFRVVGLSATISFGFKPDGSPGYLILNQAGKQTKAILE